MLNAIATLSRDEYLELDKASNIRHEYLDGQVFAMAGGSIQHARAAGNVFSALDQALLDKPCQPMNSDLRIQTASGLDTYPDVSVYCDPPELTDNDCTLLNPVVIIEVLSTSTENYDRGSKFAHYRSLDSLQDYILIDPKQVLVEHYQRLRRDEWLLQVYRQLSDKLSLKVLDTGLSLAEIYRGIAADQ